MNENNWILTSEQMPPAGKWVLVTKTYDYQKPWEIMCYMGIRIGRSCSKESNWEWAEYEFPAWTSGHGDILSQHPYAWMELPTPPIDALDI